MEVGGRYLIKDRYAFGGDIVEIKVLEISKKAIKVKYGISGNKDWITMDEFNRYEIIEKLDTPDGK